MSAPVYNSIMIGGYMPLLKRIIDTQSTNLQFTDLYTKYFKRLGIERHEMVAMVKSYTSTDPLVGTAIFRYIDEDTSIPDDTPLKPIELKDIKK